MIEKEKQKLQPKPGKRTAIVPQNRPQDDSDIHTHGVGLGKFVVQQYEGRKTLAVRDGIANLLWQRYWTRARRSATEGLEEISAHSFRITVMLHRS